MSEQHPAWLIGPWLLAWLTLWVLGRFGNAPAPSPSGRHASIDGLRGHLALAVYLHHGVIWYAYLRSGRWEAPSSNLFNQLGQASVALFFMITAFLFVGKLLAARDKPVDWTRLYASRVLRLTPLYLLAALTVLVVCGMRTDWTLRTSGADLLRALLHWLFFTIGGAVDVNGVAGTARMVSEVTWSLPLEWMFYLLLPTLAWLLRRSSGPWWMTLGTLVAAWAIWSHHRDPWMLRAFALGGLAAWLSQRALVVRLATRPMGSLLTICALGFALLATHKVRDWRPMLALAFAFTMISAGNTVFGTLVSRGSRTLGEFAYGLYLLHGLILYGTFELVIGAGKAATFSVAQHWAWLTFLTPVPVTLAWLAFHTIEQPAMALTDAFAAKLRHGLSRLPGARPQPR